MAIEAVKADTQHNNFLASDNLLIGMRGIGASSITLQTYSSTVLAQPDIKLDILPNLPTKQEAAREVADNWLKKVNPQALGTLTDIRSFANMFSSYAKTLLPIAQKIDNGDTSQIETFTKGIGELVFSAQEKSVNAQNIESDIMGFYNNARDMSDTFAVAEKTVATKISGDQGEISKLRSELQTLNSRMDSDIAKIAAGAVSDVVGVGLIVIGATSVIETGGATATLIGAGITLVSGGTLAMAIAGADMNDAQKLYSQALSKMIDLELEVAAFDTVAHQINSNSSHAKSASEAAQMMKDGWNEVIQQYTELSTNLQQGGNGYLTLKLAAAKKQWENLATQAGQILEQGNLEFEKRTISVPEPA